MIDVLFCVCMILCVAVYFWLTIGAVIEAFTYDDPIIGVLGIASVVSMIVVIGYGLWSVIVGA